MRIGIFCPSYGTLGGIEKIAASLVGEFRRLGHTVVVLARQHAGMTSGAAEVTIVRVPFHQLPRRARHIARYVRFARGLPPAVASLRRAVRQHDCDVVLTLCITSYAPYILALASGVPVVVSLQGGEPRGTFASSPRLFRSALRRAVAVAACATSLAGSARSLAPSAAGRVRVIPNGVDPDSFQGAAAFLHTREYILAVGRLTHQKGFDVLIDAMALSRKRQADVDLLIAGDGPERESLRCQSERVGVAARVRFLGATDADTTAGLYRGARLVVCPSRWEGLPLVCLEAMANERAVVAAAVDGIPDAVVHGETGVLVPPEDPSALAESISALLEEPTRCARLGGCGRRRVDEKFTWRRIGGLYDDLFAEVRRGGAL